MGLTFSFPTLSFDDSSQRLDFIVLYFSLQPLYLDLLLNHFPVEIDILIEVNLMRSVLTLAAISNAGIVD